jgi:hypothetical protein
MLQRIPIHHHAAIRANRMQPTRQIPTTIFILHG